MYYNHVTDYNCLHLFNHRKNVTVLQLLKSARFLPKINLSGNLCSQRTSCLVRRVKPKVWLWSAHSHGVLRKCRNFSTVWINRLNRPSPLSLKGKRLSVSLSVRYQVVPGQVENFHHGRLCLNQMCDRAIYIHVHDCTLLPIANCRRYGCLFSLICADLQHDLVIPVILINIQ